MRGVWQIFSKVSALSTFAIKNHQKRTFQNLWGLADILTSQCPRTFTIQNHCRQVFSEFMPVGLNESGDQT